MQRRARLVAILALIATAAACSTGGEPTTGILPQGSTPDAAPTQPTTTLGSTTAPSLTCPPADGVGTSAPALAIHSVTFMVNEQEQVVGDGDTLDAAPGDRVAIVEVEICAPPFTGAGGDACVEVIPLGGDVEALGSQSLGTHTRPVPSGFGTIPGPEESWTIGEDWEGFTAVLNHWPTEGTTDMGCGDGQCERDDYLTIALP